MLIRRKVFSVLEDETGEERLFSTNEVEYLGDEFYEIDDRMFADSEEDDSKAKKAAKYAGIGSAAALASVPVGKLAGKGVRKVAEKYRNGKIEAQEFGGKAHKINSRLVKTGKALEAPFDYVSDKVSKSADYVKNSKAGEAVGKGVDYVKNSKVVKVPAEFVKGQWNKAGKVGKAGMVAIPVATLAAAAYGGKKLHDRKKDNN